MNSGEGNSLPTRLESPGECHNLLARVCLVFQEAAGNKILHIYAYSEIYICCCRKTSVRLSVCLLRVTDGQTDRIVCYITLRMHS